MSVWKVTGGRPLCGSVRAQGSKNAALPILAASMVSPCETELLNCPALSDVRAALDILEHLGCRVSMQEDIVSIDSRGVCRCDVPDRLMQEMRSSVLFLGAILARTGRAELTTPGGCRLGARPIDLHLSALRALGAEIEEEGNRLSCRAEKLCGSVIEFPFPSVGATENAMIAACRAEGETVIRNAACEPEIVDLQRYLRAVGAEICGAGTRCIRIRGFSPRPAVGHRVMADRIVTATVLCACAACGGSVVVRGACPGDLSPVLETLCECGCDVTKRCCAISLRAPERLRACSPIITRPYPGFPTDAQPLMMAALLKSEGTTAFVENIFENRYRQIEGFRRMGARIQTTGRVALVTGVPVLRGAENRAEDLRGGAALLIAALSADGMSLVTDDAGHIARGYERLSGLFRSLGAEIEEDIR